MSICVQKNSVAHATSTNTSNKGLSCPKFYGKNVLTTISNKIYQLSSWNW